MRKILVAGGAGFIGSHLCRSLINRGDCVICVDNLITGNKQNINDLEGSDRFTFIEHDIVHKLQISKSQLNACRPMGDRFQNLDFIFHLASPASPVQYQKYPLETLRVNSIGTQNLLDLAKEASARFLYASTSEVYGDPLEHPQKESYWGNVNSFGPRSCYDEAKRYGEALCYTYLHKLNVDLRVVRIFNTYGSHMEKDDGRVISNFVSQALRGEQITVHGDGKQTRSFCYVSDMVDGLIRAMEKDNTKGEVINLGNPDERSVMEIAMLIKNITNTTSEIVHVKEREEDIERRKPDIKKAKQLLNWEPIVDLEKGLDSTIEYLKKFDRPIK